MTSQMHSSVLQLSRESDSILKRGTVIRTKIRVTNTPNNFPPRPRGAPTAAAVALGAPALAPNFAASWAAKATPPPAQSQAHVIAAPWASETPSCVSSRA